MTWWWCLKHSRPESDDQVDVAGDQRVGPYDSEEAATHWKEQFQARNEKYDDEDKQWREGHAGDPA